MAQRYLLDGNILTELEDPSKPHFDLIVARLSALSADSVVLISVLSAYEFASGIASATSDEMRVRLGSAWRVFEEYESVEITPLPLDGAGLYGQLRASYQWSTGASRRELMRHSVDFMLAVTAIAKDAVLVSDDGIFKHLVRLEPRLRVENWKVA